MITSNTKSNKLNLVATLVLIFSVFAAFPSMAATVIITSSINWSGITTGSGANGVPNANDDIYVYNGATLTVNQNAEAKSVTVGTQTGSPSIGNLVVSQNVEFDVYGNLTFNDPRNSNGNNKGINTVDLKAGSELVVVGIVGTFYTQIGTGTLTINAALPVEFISFTATKQGNEMAMLNFSTAWEVNNAGFEVERSTNGISWYKIGFIQGKGNSTEISNYSFATALTNINSAVVYYRLKQVDFNGQFEYSATRTLRLNATAAKATSVYPNPATNRISVSLEGIATGEMAKVSVMDMSGKIIISANQMAEEGSFTLDMNIDNLTKGNYIVNISSVSANFNTKLVKF